MKSLGWVIYFLFQNQQRNSFFYVLIISLFISAKFNIFAHLADNQPFMKIKKIIQHLESIAPANYQESYDNSGLIVGNQDTEIQGVLICLDSTEAVVAEAIKKGCNLIVAHHPIVFGGLKKINGKNYVERVVIKAIQNNIAIYAIHTNLDNVYYNGVNTRIAERLGLTNTEILVPKSKLKKLSTFVPPNFSAQVRQNLFNAGAGKIDGMDQLGYSSVGMTSQDGEGEAAVKIEVLFSTGHERNVIKALEDSHPYLNPRYDIVAVENSHSEIGSGMIGELAEPIAESAFLKSLKRSMKVSCIRHTKLRNRRVRKVAVCGGSGSFLLRAAMAKKADVFITADFKYHEFFDADSKIVIADIGHYESEQFTIKLLHEIITDKFSNFAAYCTEVNTNPINYLY